MPVTIEVTQSDIDAARAKNTHCPITRAICRAYGIDPRHEVIGTSKDWVEIGTSESVFFDLPPEGRTFTRAFDRGDPVRPFSFDLPVDRLPDVAVVR